MLYNARKCITLKSIACKLNNFLSSMIGVVITKLDKYTTSHNSTKNL